MTDRASNEDFGPKLERRLIDEVVVDFGPRLSLMQAKAIAEIVADELSNSPSGPTQ